MWVGERGHWRAGAAIHVALATACYLPMLLTARGRLAADTRQAVYLDPGRFVHDALWMWDPTRDLGTVTHQNIVLVWPMGLYYWLAEALGAPLWLAQRAWTGTILFAAGAGVLFLVRTIGWQRAAVPWLGPSVAAFAYALSPYALQYGTRTSVLLLPWAALPWLVGLTARALTTKGWRHPALIALVVMSIAVNATALALALLGPALWVAWAVWGARDVSGRDALAAGGRTLVLGLATSLWWVVALLIEGRFGLPLLDFTETVEQVASTSAATEVLRGLGYWIPYLQQHGYPEVSGGAFYFANIAVLSLQLALVGITLAGATLVRWRHRTFFVLLIVVGIVVGVGGYPPSDPPPLGAFFHDQAHTGGLGLVLRSTTRAAPLALLGMACLLGAFSDALVRRARVGLAVGVGAVVLVVALAPSTGRRLVDPLYSRPETLPAQWTDAIDAADAGAGSGRMLEIPGIRFAAYQWGTAYEPITAGNADTFTAWREQIPYGGLGSAELLVSLDNRLQEGRLDPRALAPLARLLGVTQLVVRNDLAYERYETIPPDRVWDLVTTAPGLGDAAAFGPLDPTGTYPAVAVVPVEGGAGLVATAPLSSTVVLDGSGDGLIDAAASGVIDGTEPILYSGATIDDPDLLDQVLDAGARIVLTDTNRRRVERWRSIHNTRGVTLRADEDPAAVAGSSGGEAQLGALPADPDWQTIAVPQRIWASATRYGNPLWFEAGVRPGAAIDGDLSTAWKVGPTVGGVGDEITIELERPVRTDHLTIVANDEATTLSSVTVRLNDGPRTSVALGPQSRTDSGQEIHFEPLAIERVAIELTSIAPSPTGSPTTPVGIAEVQIDDTTGRPITTDEVVRLPTALTDQLDARSRELPMSIVLTRLDGDRRDPSLFAEEATILREVELPTDRSFAVGGSARSTMPLQGAEGRCRTDLLSVDDQPVAVELTAAGPGATDGTLALRGCAPLALGAGTHVLRTTEGTGIDVDQIVLGSDPGGSPTPVGPDGRPSVTHGGLESTTWAEEAHDEITVDRDASTTDSWLVLGQSLNDGWELEGADAKGPVLLNGFANGFVLNGGDAERLSFAWGPQRSMWLSLAVGALGVLGALALVIRGRRWSGADVDLLAVPRLEAPWRATVPLGWDRTAVAVMVVGASAAAAVGGVWGIMAACLMVAAARSRAGHLVLRGIGLAAVLSALLWVVLDRAANLDLSAYDFFSTIPGQHRLTVFGLLLLGGDLLLSDQGTRSEDPISAARAGWARLRPTSPDPSPPAPVAVRRFVTWCTGAVVAATAAFWLILTSTSGLLDRHHTSGFYDAQAHALLGGNLDIPASQLGIEAFVVDGRSYMYQGPFPAVLRLPVAALTDSFDGRLAGVSMLLAFVVAGAATSWVLWQVRVMARGGAALHRPEAAASAAFVFAATGGSVLLFDASQVSVYHESAMWGTALAIATLGAVLRYLTVPARWTLLAASVLATATIWSRASTGLGMAGALALVVVGQLAAWWRARRTRAEWRFGAALRGRAPLAPRAIALGALACLAPVALYAAVNLAKFGSPAAVPWEDQVFAEVSSPRREFLAESDGTFFGLRFAPTTAVAYLRPDAFSLQEEFPWVGFREEGIGQRTGYGEVLFDKVDATASVPVSFPLLTILALAGLAGVTLHVVRRAALAPVLGPLLGAGSAAGTIFVFGFIAQRYLNDALPFLLVAGAVGLTLVGRWSAPRPPRVRVGVWVALTVLAVAGTWTTVADSIWYQRVYASPSDERATDELFAARRDLPHVPWGETSPVTQGPELPATGPAGSLFVVGDCAGLYVSDGSVVDELTRSSWKPVARTPAVGRYELDVVFPDVTDGTVEPLLVSGTATDPHVIGVERVDPEHIRIVSHGGDLEGAGPLVRARPGDPHHLVVAGDPGTGLSSVHLDGTEVFAGLYLSREVPTFGRNDVDDSTTPSFSGTWDQRPPDDDLCRDLLASAGFAG